ncbi:hypothetical protein E2320_005109 [Naja naja]|nr:hypothetical protein E2320_005109 [Naja naja]
MQADTFNPTYRDLTSATTAVSTKTTFHKSVAVSNSDNNDPPVINHRVFPPLLKNGISPNLAAEEKKEKRDVPKSSHPLRRAVPYCTPLFPPPPPPPPTYSIFRLLPQSWDTSPLQRGAAVGRATNGGEPFFFGRSSEHFDMII